MLFGIFLEGRVANEKSNKIKLVFSVFSLVVLIVDVLELLKVHLF
jgi:hypothetical protein